MTRKRRSQKSSSVSSQFDRLADEVAVLRESVDELKTVLEWAFRNAGKTIDFSEASEEREIFPLPTAERLEIEDGVVFEVDDDTYHSEIIAIDHDANEVTIRLLPPDTFIKCRESLMRAFDRKWDDDHHPKPGELF
jgi:hypothetical protein